MCLKIIAAFIIRRMNGTNGPDGSANDPENLNTTRLADLHSSSNINIIAFMISVCFKVGHGPRG